MNRQPFHPQLPINDSGAGQRLRRLRQQAGLSQLDLALIAGVSQRHLSCIETGRANASPSTLHALLLALDAPLGHCNEVFLAAGYAPRYGARPIEAPGLAMVLTQVRSGSGVLSFLSTFTTFGMPLDITVASLRIEHLIPADETTWEVMRAAYGQWKTTEHSQNPVQEAV